MINGISKLSIIIGFLLLYSCDNSTNPIDDSELNPLLAFEELDISYGSDSDQKFDLYLPAGRSLDTKVLVLVHGGGWTSGDKSDMNPFVTLIQNELPNYAIVNINYRLADETNPPYPMQMNDISTIINDIKVNQDVYTISDDFGFIGVSAGAHLSMLWSYAFDINADVNMVTSIVGPTNFTDPAYLENTSPELQELINVYGIDPTIEFLEEVSPYHQVTSSSPPTQLFNGGQDPLIPTSQGTDMRDRLEALNVPYEFTLYPNAGHGWVGLELVDTWTKLKDFINVHL